MTYLSTKQIAEAWGISTRRVALLASQGRIEGAVNVGNTWLIPSDAEKPSDRRTAASKDSDNTVHDKYPYLLWFVKSEDQLRSFTQDEKKMYRACMLFEAGDYSVSSLISETLLNSDDINIRLGSLYLLAFNSLYLQDYISADKYAILFNTEWHSIPNPSATLRVLMDAFNAEMGRTSDFISSAESYDFKLFCPDMYPAIICLKLFAQLAKLGTNISQSEILDLSVYEMICIMSESSGYSFAAMYLHILLSMFYAGKDRGEDERSHLKKALEICSEHGYYSTFSTPVSANVDTLEELLTDFPSEVGSRIRKSMTNYVTCRTEYAAHLKKKSLVRNLTDDDYRLISCCLHNYSINTMAEKFGLSKSGINRRLACLYDKLGVESRKELKQELIDSMLEWGR